MTKREFRRESIKRSVPPHREDYSDYRSILKEDFNCRCGYCNLKDSSITTFFEIDHLVPKAAFEHERPKLLNDYRNLVYSCKKCNSAKGKKFEGNIHSDPPSNDLFYDPATVNYNDIFYRNEFGAIASDDSKGKRMITLLKLYRPIHILGWLCEEIYITKCKLEVAIANEKNPDKKKSFEEACNSLNRQYFLFMSTFIAAYNDKSFTIDGLHP